MMKKFMKHLEKRILFTGLKMKPEKFLFFALLFAVFFIYFGGMLIAAIFPIGLDEEGVLSAYDTEYKIEKMKSDKYGTPFDEKAFWAEKMELEARNKNGRGTIIALIIAPFTPYLLLIYWADKRRNDLEKDLPDALLLISSYVKAGGTIDWAIGSVLHHVYGPLKEEFNETARQLASGASIETAMLELATRNDSPLLRNLSDLVLFGIRAGGEMTDLLTDIAMEIRMTQTLQAEIEAQVSTYKMFFTITILVVAPVLLAVATNFLGVAKGFGRMFQEEMSSGGEMTGSSMITGAQAGLAGALMEKIQKGQIGGLISVQDMELFSYCLCILSSISASALLGVIAKGEEKAGLRYIPLFVIVSVTVFFYANKFVHAFMADAFGGIV